MTSNQLLRAVFTLFVTFLATTTLLTQTSHPWSWIVAGVSVAVYLSVLGYVYVVTPSKKRHPSAVGARIEEGLRRGRARQD